MVATTRLPGYSYYSSFPKPLPKASQKTITTSMASGTAYPSLPLSKRRALVLCHCRQTSLGPGRLGDCVNLGPMFLVSCLDVSVNCDTIFKETSAHDIHENIRYIGIYPSRKVIILLVYFSALLCFTTKQLTRPTCILSVMYPSDSFLGSYRAIKFALVSNPIFTDLLGCSSGKVIVV